MVGNPSVVLVRVHPKKVLWTLFARERISNHTVISNGMCQLTLTTCEMTEPQSA